MSATPEPAMPEHEKYEPFSEQGHAIGAFLEWLEENDYQITEALTHFPTPVGRTIEEWIGEYFGIDVAAFHAETAALIEWWRSQQDGLEVEE